MKNKDASLIINPWKIPKEERLKTYNDVFAQMNSDISLYLSQDLDLAGKPQWKKLWNTKRNKIRKVLQNKDDPSFQAVLKLVRNAEPNIDFSDEANYCEIYNEIHIPRPEQYTTVDDFCQTLLYLLSLWVRHRNRMEIRFYSREQQLVIAELTSAFLCPLFGVKPTKNQHIYFISELLDHQKSNVHIMLLRNYKLCTEIAEYLLAQKGRKRKTQNKKHLLNYLDHIDHLDSIDAKNT